MKFIFLSLSLFFMSINIVGQTPNISLSDINSGKYAAKGIGSWVSSADGKQFYKLNKDRTKIEVFDFKTGNKLESFFDITTARNCNLKSIDNFLISPDGKKLFYSLRLNQNTEDLQSLFYIIMT